MKKILLTGLMIASISLMNAQTEVVLTTSANYANDVYYKLKDVSVEVAARNTWDIAFITGKYNITILLNKGSYLNDGIGAELYTYPNGTTDAWSTLDTAGLNTWPDMYNDYTSFDNGAFTQNTIPGDDFDYGWGRYNPGNHHITGDSLFVIKTIGGTYKKLWIVDKNSIANSWIFKFANLDGSEEKEVTFNAGDYATKNFIYYSIDDTTFVDREPAKEEWDMVFTNWGVLLNYGGMPFPQGVTGVLTNEYADIEVLEVKESGLDQATYESFDKSKFITDPNTIGSDWKSFDFSSSSYKLSDTTVFFIKKSVKNEGIVTSSYWKLYFTVFAGSTTGDYTFIQKELETAVSTGNQKPTEMLEVYPNPATEFINLVYDSEKEIDVRIFDASGKMVYSELISDTGFSNHQVDVRNLSDGIYFIRTQSGNETGNLKFIKN